MHRAVAAFLVYDEGVPRGQYRTWSISRGERTKKRRDSSGQLHSPDLHLHSSNVQSIPDWPISLPPPPHFVFKLRFGRSLQSHWIGFFLGNPVPPPAIKPSGPRLVELSPSNRAHPALPATSFVSSEQTRDLVRSMYKSHEGILPSSLS